MLLSYTMLWVQLTKPRVRVSVMIVSVARNVSEVCLRPSSGDLRCRPREQHNAAFDMLLACPAVVVRVPGGRALQAAGMLLRFERGRFYTWGGMYLLADHHDTP